MLKEYTRNKHQFFDDLLTYLIGEVCFPVSMSYFNALYSIPQKQVPKFGEHQGYLLEGIKGATDQQIRFYPHDTMRKLLNNQWPDEFQLEFEDLKQNERLSISIDGGLTYTEHLFGGAFCQYWDKIHPQIKKNHGENPSSWPIVLDFARVMRNTFAHGNKISITNPNAREVNWMSLSYNSNNNGNKVLFKDMGIADFIILIEDIEKLV